MPKDKTASHQLVAKAAKQEFLANGFLKASMRRIGQKANMTQAGLYRHYASKENMFEAIVEPAIKEIQLWQIHHTQSQFASIESMKTGSESFSGTDVDLMREVIYKYKDEFRMILVCSQGTKYEHFIDDLVRLEQEEMMNALATLKAHNKNVREISAEEMHVLLSAYVTALFEPLVHDWPIEKAIHNLRVVEEFFTPGWKKIMGF